MKYEVIFHTSLFFYPYLCSRKLKVSQVSGRSDNQKAITKCRRFNIMDLKLARVIYDNHGYEPGTSYTRDPYQQARDAYHEAESVLRDAGEL